MNDMKSSEIQEAVYAWAMERIDVFNAPYGVLTSCESDKGDRQRWRVTFGIARVLDVIVTIYSPGFIILEDNMDGRRGFKSFPGLMKEMNRQYGRSEV